MNETRATRIEAKYSGLKAQEQKSSLIWAGMQGATVQWGCRKAEEP